jgi:hypothetical protein
LGFKKQSKAYFYTIIIKQKCKKKNMATTMVMKQLLPTAEHKRIFKWPPHLSVSPWWPSILTTVAAVIA